MRDTSKQTMLSQLTKLKNRLSIAGILKPKQKLLPNPTLDGSLEYKTRRHNLAILVKPNSDWRIISAGKVYRGEGLNSLYTKLEELKHD